MILLRSSSTTLRKKYKKTRFHGGESPKARTRFCLVLVREKGKWAWDIWVYGGQSSGDPGDQEPPGDMWVLTIPAFVYVF